MDDAPSASPPPPRPAAPPPALRPLPYHRRLVEYLKTAEPALWSWFAGERTRAEHAAAVRLDLLKSTYRMDRGSHPALYRAADDVAERLGVRAPVTLYQGQSAAGLNAGLAWLPGEAHVLFVGDLLAVLSDAELRGVLGHELTHFLFFELDSGEYLVADRILRALANAPRPAPSHLESARLFALWTEVLGDRGALAAVGEPAAAIRALLKTLTGLADVSAESYLRQADEIFAAETVRSQEPDHPEPFIRARALRLFAETGEAATPEIARMLEGPLSLRAPDLLAQQRLTGLTRRLLRQLLAPAWMRSESALAHARLFFDDFGKTPEDESTLAGSAAAAGAPADRELLAELRAADESARDYFGYCLLDFAAVDPALEEAPLAAAFTLAEGFGFGDRLRELAATELKQKKRALDRLRKEAPEILARAAEGGGGNGGGAANAASAGGPAG